MTVAPERLAPKRFIARLAELAADGQRRLVALAGAPGSGKSTLAGRAADALNGATPGSCVVVPMDGFHLDDGLLEPRGWRPRKGAPHTFDVEGLASLLARLRAAAEPEVLFPVFDRGLELSRAAAGVAKRDVPLILVEGNYLLLDAAPWNALGALFDLAALADCPEDVLRDRLTARWRDAGLDAAEVRRRVEENDLPNARSVIEGSAVPDILVDATV